MMEKIALWLKRLAKVTPKDTYLKWLEQFDSQQNTIANLPVMLVEFWDRVNPGDFKDGPSFRDMMYVDITLRHGTITELANILELATAAIAQDDDKTLHEISLNQFATYQTITLDDYFSGREGGSITYTEGITNLKSLMMSHKEVLDNITLTYQARMLNRMYNDIHTVTDILINQMKEAQAT